MQGTKQEAYYQLVGQIAMNWAALEAIVASAIWHIGGIHDDIGACVTSQIYTLRGKIDALRAILTVRSEGDLSHLSDEQQKEVVETADKLRAFFDKRLRGLAEYRHRTVHDPIHFENDQTSRLQITAPGKLTLGYQPVDLEEMVEKWNAIAKAVDDLEVLLKPALSAFPPPPRSSADKPDRRPPPG